MSELLGSFLGVERTVYAAAFMTAEVDPASAHRLLSPARELLMNRHRHKGTTGARPQSWPPSQGQVWQDRNGKRWICPQGGYLVCIASIADDNAEEIWRHHGPMALVTFIAPTEEAPF